MRIKIDIERPLPRTYEIGNVYPCRGGRAASAGHMWLLVGVDEVRRMGALLQIDRDGQIVGATAYGLHHIEDLRPIAFAEGLEELEIIVRGLP